MPRSPLGGSEAPPAGSLTAFTNIRVGKRFFGGATMRA